eukprot:TRINITY_DN74345_c0_g1_i1.p1 TRINITY_DN74345_c0_g1~~TRINITY_DN74345_c0_g1_i1.p1  ORF type:complete len:338 (-),score=40.44 TRINITY_DN74345_c0_g1_i1:91-1053(-)
MGVFLIGLAFVYTSAVALRPSDLSEVNTSASKHLSETKSKICQYGRMITDLFKCVQEHELPLFARDGFLLGVVRESSFIHFGQGSYDNDVDIGCLEDDYDKILEFFVDTAANNSCLVSKGLKISKVLMQPPGALKGCVAPSAEAQRTIASTERSSVLEPDLSEYLKGLCNIPSRIGGFVASLDRGDASLGLSLSVLPKSKKSTTTPVQTHTTTYLLDLSCVQSWNCPNEVRMWYMYESPKYHPAEPGQELLRHYPEDLFKPYRTAKFNLAPGEHGTILVPRNAVRYLELSYGSQWRVPVKKSDLSLKVAPAAEKSFLCSA